jgi:hypothetical protein
MVDRGLKNYVHKSRISMGNEQARRELKFDARTELNWIEVCYRREDRSYLLNDISVVRSGWSDKSISGSWRPPRLNSTINRAGLDEN